MLSSQLFWRIFGVYAALTIGTAVAFILILTARHQDAVRDQAAHELNEDLQTIGALLKQAKFDGQELPPATRNLLTAIGQHKECRIALVSDRDEVLWSSQPQDGLWEGIASAPEVRDARQFGSGWKERPAPGDADRSDSRWLYHALAFKQPAEHPVMVCGALPLHRRFAALAGVHYQLWGAAATIAVLALAITYLVVGRIIGPLETLTQAAEQMAAGEIPREVSFKSQNEIGRLATVFNTMNRQLTSRFRDLQEQRQQSEANLQRLETVLEAMFEGVLAVDAQERLLFANNAALRLMDLKPSSVLGRPFWEAIRHQPLHDVIRRAMRDGGSQRVEVELPRTQSLVAVAASRLPGDPPPGAVVVIHDITELRRLEKLRRDFVQNVSHELKTPLSSIAAYADTLLEGGLDDASNNRQFVERIAEQADRLHRLILDMLALARMESADEGFEVEPIDVSRVLLASIEAHEQVAQAKRITLVTEGPRQPVWGLADDEGLRTIADNLLDNAINYTPVGGKVTIRWKSVDDKVVIQVQDTGVGIAHEHQQRIFQRFYRIDKARSRELGGTGLGLSIVKHLCQAFSGSVSVYSHLGQGSTFTVELRGAPHLVAV